MKPNRHNKFTIAASRYRIARVELTKTFAFIRAGIGATWLFDETDQFTITPDRADRIDDRGLAFICTPSLSDSINERVN